jgi:hypothetical protein
MEVVEIIEQDQAPDRVPWGPPLWLVGLALCSALVVGLVQSAQVRDPRVADRPSATPCAPTSPSQAPHAPSYVWTFCR